jgi:hypothetical protein
MTMQWKLRAACRPPERASEIRPRGRVPLRAACRFATGPISPHQAGHHGHGVRPEGAIPARHYESWFLFAGD